MILRKLADFVLNEEERYENYYDEFDTIEEFHAHFTKRVIAYTKFLKLPITLVMFYPSNEAYFTGNNIKLGSYGRTYYDYITIGEKRYLVKDGVLYVDHDCRAPTPCEDTIEDIISWLDITITPLGIEKIFGNMV